MDVTAYKQAFKFTSKSFASKKLSEIAFINPNTSFEKLNSNEIISFIPMDAIDESIGEIAYTETKRLDETKGYTRFRQNDLIWAKITPCMQNGKSAVVKETLNGYACGSTEFFIIRPKTKSILPEYLQFLLRDSRVLKDAQNYFGGSAGQQRVSVSFLNNFEVPILPLSIQEKIVEQLRIAKSNKKEKEGNASQIILEIDKFIGNKIGFEFPEIVNKSTFTTKVTDLERRFDPHFYLPSFKALIDNIRQIKHSQLGEVVEFSNETWNQKDGFETEFPYIEISEIDLTSGKIRNISYISIREAPSRARMLVRTNDIIVSTTRPQRGAIALISQEQNGFIASTGFAVLRRMLREDVSKEYLFYILRTQICLQQMLQRSSGGSYPAITIEELKKIYIPTPVPDIQLQIVEDIKSFVDKAEALKVEAKADLEKAKKEIETLIHG